jgi:TonB family protein
MGDLEKDIERYQKGELTPAERHALEKRALTDPFLADALDGLELIGTNEFTSDVTALRKQLVAKQEKTKVWFSPLRVAAALALLLISAFILYTVIKPIEPVTLASQEAKTPQPVVAHQVPKSDSIISSLPKKTAQNLLSLQQPAPSRSHALEKKREMPAKKPASPPAAPRDVAGVQTIPEKVTDQDKASDDAKVEEEMISNQKDTRVQQARATQLNNAAGANKAFESSVPLTKSRKMKSPLYSVSGKVTSEDHAGIPGANVSIKGTDIGTVTDTAGNYRINSADPIPSLVISFIGFQTREVDVKDASTVDVQLFSDVGSLSEVVVTGYGLAKEDDARENVTVQLAEPSGGRKSFDKYLYTNLRYPQTAVAQKVEGEVTVEFIVKSDGTLSDFNVLHGIGAGCDEELIRLIKDGPRWSPNTKDKIPRDSKVRIRLKFSLPR